MAAASATTCGGDVQGQQRPGHLLVPDPPPAARHCQSPGRWQRAPPRRSRRRYRRLRAMVQSPFSPGSLPAGMCLRIAAIQGRRLRRLGLAPRCAAPPAAWLPSSRRTFSPYRPSPRAPRGPAFPSQGYRGPGSRGPPPRTGRQRRSTPSPRPPPPAPPARRSPGLLQPQPQLRHRAHGLEHQPLCPVPQPGGLPHNAAGSARPPSPP